jgi:hypothetical protein
MSRATDPRNGSERTKEMTPRESRRHLAETGRGGTRLTGLAASLTDRAGR